MKYQHLLFVANKRHLWTSRVQWRSVRGVASDTGALPQSYKHLVRIAFPAALPTFVSVGANGDVDERRTVHTFQGVIGIMRYRLVTATYRRTDIDHNKFSDSKVGGFLLKVSADNLAYAARLSFLELVLATISLGVLQPTHALLRNGSKSMLPLLDDCLNAISYEGSGALPRKNTARFLDEFEQGAIMAFETVSQALAANNPSALMCMLENKDELDSVANALCKLSESNRQLLNVTKSDLVIPENDRYITDGDTMFKLRPSPFPNPMTIVDIQRRKVVGGSGVYFDFHLLFNAIYNQTELLRILRRTDSPSLEFFKKSYGFSLPRLVFGNLILSRKVKPTVEDDWKVSAINYVVF